MDRGGTRTKPARPSLDGLGLDPHQQLAGEMLQAARIAATDRRTGQRLSACRWLLSPAPLPWIHLVRVDDLTDEQYLDRLRELVEAERAALGMVSMTEEVQADDERRARLEEALQLTIDLEFFETTE